MARDDAEMTSAKRAYRSAKEIGNRKEEARWANVIGDYLKKRGEYVEALIWLRIDYEISKNYLVDKDLLPACQSIGELHLRLHHFDDALRFQTEHLRLAKEANDLVEQQRASTQLGRTYHDMFSESDDNHSALHNAKKYFNSAMSLAHTLKEHPPNPKSSFLKEYIDAYNNIGLLEMDLDNLEEAEKILTKGLNICDDEEVNDDDDARSRLHHNLGVVYTRLRNWDQAREHIQKDILICRNIGHLQGEAKGFINLGEYYVQCQKFHEAIASYQRALRLANSMEDEHALVSQIKGNIQVVKEYIKVMEEIKTEEQSLKKLKRSLAGVKGTSAERKCLKQQMACVDRLLEKSFAIAAWSKHLEFAKLRKRIAAEFCDKEKLGDSFVVVGESYQKLRNFKKACKWYNKSWEIYELIGNLEGQAIVKINMGDVLDSEGDSKGALKSFQEGYRLAVEANKIHTQIMALENMHYCQMMRFDNADEVRSLKHQIENLKALVSSEQVPQTACVDSCSETDTEENGFSGPSGSSKFPHTDAPDCTIEEIDSDGALSSLPHSCQKSQKFETEHGQIVKRIPRSTEASPKSLSKSLGTPSTAAGRKRTRLVLSDDENHSECTYKRHTDTVEDVVTSDKINTRIHLPDVSCDLPETESNGCKDDAPFCHLVNVEESSCSHKSCTLHEASLRRFKSSGLNEHCIRIKVEDVLVCIDADPYSSVEELDVETLKVEAACSYYLQLSSQKRSSGLLPIIGELKSKEQAVTSNDLVETVKFHASTGDWIEASVNGWVQKRLVKTYIDCCLKLAETPNIKLLMKLYNLEISEDEVIVSDCELQDMSIVPLLEALHAQKNIAMLDLSHNMLGNATMERLQQVFMLSGQKYGALVIDLHSNMFGPTVLFQICECPVLLSRLEVLNISGNRLTDACGIYLSTILRNCKGLYSLNIERCSITSRTIQAVADALDSGSVLSQLYIGDNNPISGSSLVNLLKKLATIERFSELSLKGLKLNKPALEYVSQLATSSCLSGLLLGGSNIGCEGASHLTESLFHEPRELVKLDLSSCGVTHKYFHRQTTLTQVVSSVLELNLGGNPIMFEGGSALASLLANPRCSLKVLLINKCQLGLSGIVHIINSLTENASLEELNLAENIEVTHNQPLGNEAMNKDSKAINGQSTDAEEDLGVDQMEVADSYENVAVLDHTKPEFDDTCSSQGQKNIDESDKKLMEKLSSAIRKATKLELLDLGNNGFSTEIYDTLYKAWCSSLRCGLGRVHLRGQTFHLYVHGRKCCVKPCCPN